jgi:predicted chitinase
VVYTPQNFFKSLHTMNSKKLAWHRENGRLQHPKFERLAAIGDKREEAEKKKLSIQYNSSTKDDDKIYLTFLIETPTIKSSTATIFVEEMNAVNEIAVPKTIVTGLKSNSKQSVKVSFDKTKKFDRYIWQDGFVYQATITIDDFSAKTDEFKLKYEKTTPEKEEKCLCKKTSWTADDLRYIVTELRKLEDKHFETQYDEKLNPYFIDDNGKVVKSNDRGKAPKVGYKKYKVEKTFYDSKAGDGKLVEDRIFYMDLGENIDEKEANYKSLAKWLNEILPKYKINTCLRKLHFFTQVYTETQRFGSTYESDESAKKAKEDFYRGRGFVHITHYYGYKEFYIHLYSKEPSTKELEHFVPNVASKMEYAIKSAAWYWEKNDINGYADIDEIEKVSAAIQYPDLLKQKIFKPDEIRMLDKRKEYYRNLKNILKYDECK